MTMETPTYDLFPRAVGYYSSGWWYTYPSETYESQWEGLSPI